MKSGIYMIISPTAKVYIGQSVDLESRYKRYKTKCDERQRAIYNSILKYGFENHFFDVMEYCPIDKLNERERFWQDEYDVLGEYGLNCKLTKTEDRSGHISEETKQKLREKRKLQIMPPVSDETRRKRSAAMKGRTYTPEALKKMSESRKGKKRSLESIAKMVETRRLKNLPVSNSPK